MGKAVGVVIEGSRRTCDFCHESMNDEVSYGPLYTIGSITCHYFCILFSTKLIQKGKDGEGVLGFLFTDIQTELKKHKQSRCSYCKNTEATINCCYRSCRQIYHFPCGVKNGAMTLFYKTFQSFCVKHRKKQSIPKSILAKQKVLRIQLEKLPSSFDADNIMNITKMNNCIIKRKQKPDFSNDVCYICYENVVFDVPYDIFWPSCCKVTAWFHRRCLSKMALSAGLHFIRCPLCNNTSNFKESLLKFGIFIPQRDASWESENGAFTELLERPNNCTAVDCSCPEGRTYQLERWDMLYCKFCGSEAIHRRCIDYSARYLCQSCEKFTEKTDAKNDTFKETEENISVSKEIEIQTYTNLDMSVEYIDSKSDVTPIFADHQIVLNYNNNENKIDDVSMESIEVIKPINSGESILDSFDMADERLKLEPEYEAYDWNSFELANNSLKLEPEFEEYRNDIHISKEGEGEVDPYKSCTIKFDIAKTGKHDIIFKTPIKYEVNDHSELSDNKQTMNKNSILEYFSTINEETKLLPKHNVNKSTEKERKKSKKIRRYENYSILKYLLDLEEKHKRGSPSNKFYVIKRKVKKCVFNKNVINSNCDIKKYFSPIENRVKATQSRVMVKNIKKRRMEFTITEEDTYMGRKSENLKIISKHGRVN